MTIWDERYQSGEGLRWWPNEELVRFLGKTYGDPRKNPCRGQMAIDLGCGTGCNMLALNQWGFFPYGYDCEAAIAVARSYLQSMVFTNGLNRYEISPLLLPGHIPCTDNTAALVVDCQTGQHFSWLQRADLYKEAVRVLAPGGIFWSMCWAGPAMSAQHIYGGCYPELDYMEACEWLDVWRECGLHPTHSYRVTRSYFIDGEQVIGSWLVAEGLKP